MEKEETSFSNLRMSFLIVSVTGYGLGELIQNKVMSLPPAQYTTNNLNYFLTYHLSSSVGAYGSLFLLHSASAVILKRPFETPNANSFAKLEAYNTHLNKSVLAGTFLLVANEYLDSTLPKRQFDYVDTGLVFLAAGAYWAVNRSWHARTRTPKSHIPIKSL